MKQWKKLLKEIKPSSIGDDQLAQISTLYAKLAGTRPVLPCKCDGHLWGKWIAMIKRQVEKQEKEDTRPPKDPPPPPPPTNPEPNEVKTKQEGIDRRAKEKANKSPEPLKLTLKQWDEKIERLTITSYGKLTDYARYRKRYTEKEVQKVLRENCSFKLAPSDEA